MNNTYPDHAQLVHMINELDKSEWKSPRYRYILKSILHYISMRKQHKDTVPFLLIMKAVAVDLRKGSLRYKVTFAIKVPWYTVRSITKYLIGRIL
jgi:translation elongation factor EF-1alpha